MKEETEALLRIRHDLWTARGPIVIFNKSHSGSRLLAKVIESSGVFMGAHQNDSKDSLDLLRLVQYLVVHHFPDYGPLLEEDGEGDPLLPSLTRTVFASHLEGFDRSNHAPWGWKNCASTYIVPVLDFLFPNAKFIHLIRDGRDIAFSDHHGADTPYRKKIIFNSDQIEWWGKYKLTGWSYLKHSHVFNALHWVNSVSVGRQFGEKLGDRYMEIRYEDLCQQFELHTAHILRFIGRENAASKVIDEIGPTVRRTSLHKFERQSQRKVDEVLEIASPLLRSLGYLEGNVDTL